MFIMFYSHVRCMCVCVHYIINARAIDYAWPACPPACARVYLLTWLQVWVLVSPAFRWMRALSSYRSECRMRCLLCCSATLLPGSLGRSRRLPAPAPSRCDILLHIRLELQPPHAALWFAHCSPICVTTCFIWVFLRNLNCTQLLVHYDNNYLITTRKNTCMGACAYYVWQILFVRPINTYW